MRKIVRIVFFLITINLAGQKKYVEPNYSFIKLVVTNASNEILLVKWGNDWEIQGRKFVGNLAMKEFINDMAKNAGVAVKNIQLRGLFTFHYEGSSKPTLMHYYEASYVSGTIKVPPSCSEITWVPIDKSIEKIAYKDMKHIIKRIVGNKNVWGGALEIFPKMNNRPRDFKFKTKFYRFN